MTKLCFVSLSRSDYTSLVPVMKAALRDSRFQVSVVAGGSHLLKRFGESIHRFETDGIKIDASIDYMSEFDDSDKDIAMAYGRATSLLVNEFARLQPDLIFILGDRWEILAAANAAALMKTPLVHHSGGDLTQGALDNQIRYSISAFAHLHLTATDEHRARLIAIGEESWRVTATGEPALTTIDLLVNSGGLAKGKRQRIDLQIQRKVKTVLGVEADSEFVLATLHPTSFESVSLDRQVDVFLELLKLIPETLVLTAPNPDAGSRRFSERLTDFALLHKNVKLHSNLGGELYYNAMACAKYMVGNSSSGIWEAPSFALPVLNLGERQADRTRAPNVVDVPFELIKAKLGLEKVRSSEFKASLAGIQNPYFREGTVDLILDAIFKGVTDQRVLHKKFVDPLKARIQS